ncbi:hypothetical protein VIGAN_01532900 [Vigna angularis var. angularis]|uniref:Uncharacterized protein n=1 Tax=Vigna angularis var. angularis TaxID=157739 RepID=A0A0S3R9I9_PHAAN|nr:hypothetical protein VIGAN_01532900 [Vigna angularis var. angularis]
MGLEEVEEGGGEVFGVGELGEGGGERSEVEEGGVEGGEKRVGEEEGKPRRCRCSGGDAARRATSPTICLMK